MPGRWALPRLLTDSPESSLADNVSAWRWLAAVREQPILLLDEPFCTRSRAAPRCSPVQEVRQRQQLTMLMVSHSIEDAARIAPRSVVIAEGRIVWEGETEELMSGKASASHLLGILNG